MVRIIVELVKTAKNVKLDNCEGSTTVKWSKTALLECVLLLPFLMFWSCGLNLDLLNNHFVLCM